MSADQLRRAAKTLRQRVAELPVRVQSDWVQDSSEIYTEPAHEWVGETLQDGGDEIACYVVLMHPSVGLALAKSLDDWAEIVDGVDKMLGHIPDDAYPAEFALARAILREES